MTRRANHDAVLLELVGEVVGLLELEELCHGVLVALLRAVPSKWASLNEVGPERVLALVEPHLDEVWTDRFAEHAQENPIDRHFMRTRDGRAYRFSDVGSREALQATTLYREVYEPLGIEHQIAFTLPAEAGRVLAVVTASSACTRGRRRPTVHGSSRGKPALGRRCRGEAPRGAPSGG